MRPARQEVATLGRAGHPEAGILTQRRIDVFLGDAAIASNLEEPETIETAWSPEPGGPSNDHEPPVSGRLDLARDVVA